MEGNMQELTVTAQRVRAKMRRYASYRGLPGFVALLLAMWYLHSTWRVSKSLPDITPSAVGAIRELVTQPPHKFVVIAGMERTGSTWQFMAVRQIYRAHGHSVDHVHTHSLQAIFDHELCVARNVTCIVKIHEYEPALLLLADYVLVSHRDPRDILMSVSQTFDSCLDYSRRTCPGNPDIGQLPKEPALDMTTHLSHYQKWRPVAHYDMKYELMMQDPIDEIVRLAYVLEMQITRGKAEIIDAEINAMSASRKTKAAQWDPTTGLAKHHVHKSNKSDAHKDDELVTSLSYPLGPCDLRKEFKEIERRHGKWMGAAGYMGSPATSKQFTNDALDASRQAATTHQNTMVRSSIPLVHVVNYFVGSKKGARKGDQGLHDWEIVLTQASVRRALLRARAANVDVTFVAAVFPGEESSIGALSEMATTCFVMHNKTQHIVGLTGPPVPYIQDIFECALKSAQPDAVVIYTNADIGVQEDFYQSVRDLATVSQTEKTSYSVTRRELLAHASHDFPALANAGQVTKALDGAYKMRGMDHKGHDTFIMPASVLRSLDLGRVTIAYSPWGCTLSALLHSRSGFRVLPKLRWTFHFGSLTEVPDVAPGSWITCNEIHNNTAAARSGSLSSGVHTYCGSEAVAGLCCGSCAGDLRTVTKIATAAAVPGAHDNCNWHKSYGLARAEQSRANWAATMSNVIASLEALKNNAPSMVRRCCALASRGERSYATLKHHWANPEFDASPSCCVVAGGIFEKQPPRELLTAWCRVNVVDERIDAIPADKRTLDRESLRRMKKYGPHRPAPKGDFTHIAQNTVRQAQSRMNQTSSVAGKTVLLFHEDTPSTLQGGDLRAYQLTLWLCKNKANVIVITRGLEASKADPQCKFKQRAEATPSSEFSRLNRLSKIERRVFALSLVSSIGAQVIEDDACLSRTRKALLIGGDTVIPRIGQVDNIFAMLWFYREDIATGLSLKSLPALVLEIMDEQPAKVVRPLFAVLSDDIHHERAKAIASVRGDTDRRAKEIERAELTIYAHPKVDRLFGVTKADAESYIRFRDKGRRKTRPVIAALPFVSSTTLPMPYNCTQGWWESDALVVPHRPFGNRNDLLYIGSGHYSNSIAVSWILEVVLPMWAYLSYIKMKENRIPGPEEVPVDFSTVKISASAQNTVPRLLLAGAPKWRSLRRNAVAKFPSLKQMYTGVVIPPDGFVPDLSEAFDRAKVLLAPNFVYGSGISTKIMQGLEHGVPVVVNTHGGNGYDCDDETEGRLRCAHMQLCGAPTRQGRNAGNHTIDGYWYARSAMGLMKNKARWQELVENGRRYVAHTRSLSSWDVVLEPLFANRTRASGRISSS